MYLPLLLILCFLSAAIAEEKRATISGEWGGLRTKLREWGLEVSPLLIMDDTWNLKGGKQESHSGVFEYVFDLQAELSSEPLFHYSGGTLLFEVMSHHGRSPSVVDVGSFMDIDFYEAPPFDELYALYYRQSIQNDRHWILVGKNDAGEIFDLTPHSALFFNAGYDANPPLLFFPTYPDPAMGIVGSIGFVDYCSLVLGLYDGSLATGRGTGNHGFSGEFFHHLYSHAYLIGELDVAWLQDSYPGKFGIGAWNNTATIKKLNGHKKDGTGGYYTIFDQTFYKSSKQEAGLFLGFSAANPAVSEAHTYVCAGVTGKGFFFQRHDDIIGLGMSRSNFTTSKSAGFTKPYEASFEAFYLLQFSGWGFVQPDFQYIVNTGGKGLPNASVFSLRIQALF